MKKIDCPGCQKGVNMCKYRPCWGTPEDFEIIIKEGFAHNLMIDWFSIEDENNRVIYLLCGANNGCEGSKASFNPIGECIFLEDDLCSIHHIKPTEGAISCCKTKTNISHYDLAKTWDTEYGKALIEMWINLTGYEHKEDYYDYNPMMGFKIMMEALLKKI